VRSIDRRETREVNSIAENRASVASLRASELNGRSRQADRKNRVIEKSDHWWIEENSRERSDESQACAVPLSPVEWARDLRARSRFTPVTRASDPTLSSSARRVSPFGKRRGGEARVKGASEPKRADFLAAAAASKTDSDSRLQRKLPRRRSKSCRAQAGDATTRNAANALRHRD
jgi:hypothetical protein